MSVSNQALNKQKKMNLRTILFTVSLICIGGVFLSCKKNWTCQCEPDENSMKELTHHPIEDKTQKDAEAACKEYSTEGLDCTLR